MSKEDDESIDTMLQQVHVLIESCKKKSDKHSKNHKQKRNKNKDNHSLDHSNCSCENNEIFIPCTRTCPSSGNGNGNGTGGLSSGGTIPFSSNVPVVMTSSPRTGALIAFGNSVSGVPIGQSINLAGGPNVPLNMAFSLPSLSLLGPLAVFYSNVVQFNRPPGVTVTLTIQLYQSPGPDEITNPTNTFVPVPGIFVSFILPQTLNPGQTLNGIVTQTFFPRGQTRLLLVASITSSPITPLTITGYVSAGLR